MNLLHPLQKYQEQSIVNRFFKHTDLLELLGKLNSEKFLIKNIGESAEGRSLNLVEYGNGETRIFLWSQMHGDEATATMALFDLFNFLDADDELNELRNSIFNSCTLYILPMVNPDGAQVFSRRNAQGIDINRDFKKRQSPEGRILVEICDHIKPQYGFNLHDQSTIWSAGKTGNPATISMLAPAFDEKLSINDTRLKAMQVISLINKEIRQIIPDHVGRFKDDFEPRAFGDNFQALDISTILIEAGGYADDSEKQFIRKLYFKAILKGLEVIACNSHLTENSEDYFSIPENEKLHFQILLKNCELLCNGLSYQADIGLIAVEDADEDCRSVSYTYIIEDIGDLDGFNGYETINVQGMEVILIKQLICQENADFLIRDGMTTILCIENGRITEKM